MHKGLTITKKMKIKPIISSEYIFLDDFLYDAIFIPEGVIPPEKSIIQQPAAKSQLCFQDVFKIRF